MVRVDLTGFRGHLLSLWSNATANPDSTAFGERCEEAGTDLSMTSGGSPLDNSGAESFFAT